MVALTFGVSDVCRRNELVKMTVDDVEYKGSIIVVTLGATQIFLKAFLYNNQ